MAIRIQGTVVISDTQDLTVTGYPQFNTTGALKVPVGTDAQRPTAATGQIRFNSTSNAFEGYNGTTWGTLGGGLPASGSFTDLTITGNLTVTSTGAVRLASGTTAQRPGSATAGMIRFNTETGSFEGFNGTAWGAIGGSSAISEFDRTIGIIGL